MDICLSMYTWWLAECCYEELIVLARRPEAGIGDFMWWDRVRMRCHRCVHIGRLVGGGGLNAGGGGEGPKGQKYGNCYRQLKKNCRSLIIYIKHFLPKPEILYLSHETRRLDIRPPQHLLINATNLRILWCWTCLSILLFNRIFRTHLLNGFL